MDKLNARRLAIVCTTRCTLRCKLCSNFMPKFSDPQDVPYDKIIADLDHVFELFDHIEWLQFVGGEIFMNKEMSAVYEYCLKYKDRFDKLVLMTNATLTPSQQELSALSKYGEKFEAQISDYGSLSCKMMETCKAYESAGLSFQLKKYHGRDQHFGGWIDNTQFIEQKETEEETHKRTAKCSQGAKGRNMHILHGLLHRCAVSCFMSALNIIEPDKRDFVDLNTGNESLDEKREIIKNFYKHPVQACRRCLWSETDTGNLMRFTAAEQLELLKTSIVEQVYYD
jgi:MoaA/NifB/PqqE/SkfB family radical SAM enzyme